MAAGWIALQADCKLFFGGVCNIRQMFVVSQLY